MTDKKLSEKKEARWTKAQELGQGVKDAGRHVWLAGLGAIDSVDKGGRGLFSDLVARGERLEARERPVLEERFRKVGDRVAELRDQLEHRVEDRLAGALQRFGVPDRGEVQQLIERIEKLTRQIEGMTAKS